jgi:hypothetical protein
VASGGGNLATFYTYTGFLCLTAGLLTFVSDLTLLQTTSKPALIEIGRIKTGRGIKHTLFISRRARGRPALALIFLLSFRCFVFTVGDTERGCLPQNPYCNAFADVKDQSAVPDL